MKRSMKRKQELSPPRPPPPPASIAVNHPIPPASPSPPPTTPFPLLSRYRLPIFLTLSVAAAAFAAFEYRRHERQAERPLPSSSAAPHSASASPPSSPQSSDPSLSGRCPVLVSSAPSVIAANSVLRRIGRYGLPALPYVDREAAYAYPLLVRESYVSQYNTRTRNANWVIEILNAATAPHAATTAPATPLSPPSALPDSASAPAAALHLPDAASRTPPAPSSLSRSASAPAVSSSSSLPSSPSLPRSPSRELSTFHTDPALLPSSFPATPSSFLSSSLDRGHLVPAADSRQSQRAMDDSFLLTNVSPQHPRFNRQYWSAVESWVRSLRSRWAEIIVVSGPLWLPEGETATAQEEEAGGAGGAAAGQPATSGNRTRRIVRYEMIPSSSPSIHVPTHFFKIIVATSPVASAPSSDVVLASLVLPNAPLPASLPLSSFLSSLAAIQHSAGFTFFPLLQPDSEAPVKREKEKENSIDVASLLVDADSRGAGGGGGADSGSRGMTALEKRSVLELCGGGGCDLSAQWKELAAWDDINRKKDRAAAPHRTSKAADNENAVK